MSGDGTLIYWDLINRHMWGVNGYEWSACSVDCGTSWKRQKRKKWMRMSPRPSITPRADPNVLPDACGLSTLTRDRSLLKSDRVPRNQARLLISCSAWLIAPPGCLSFSGQRLCLSQPPILGNQGTHHSRYTWLPGYLPTKRLHFESLIWFLYSAIFVSRTRLRVCWNIMQMLTKFQNKLFEMWKRFISIEIASKASDIVGASWFSFVSNAKRSAARKLIGKEITKSTSSVIFPWSCLRQDSRANWPPRDGPICRWRGGPMVRSSGPVVLLWQLDNTCTRFHREELAVTFLFWVLKMGDGKIEHAACN